VEEKMSEVLEIKGESYSLVYGESDLPKILSLLVPFFPKQSLIGLDGNLGAGKTSFVRALCHALSIKDFVSSPTYVLEHRYEGIGDEEDTILIRHWDLYRLRVEDEETIQNIISFSDSVDKEIVCIEWIERFPVLYENLFLHIDLNFFKDNENLRQLTISGKGVETKMIELVRKTFVFN